MANTYVAIATTTVGSGGAANIEFTSIPQTYTDLLIKTSGRTDRVATNAEFFIKLNGDVVADAAKKLYGNGSSVGSQGGNAVGVSNGSNNTASTFSSTEIYIPNYTGSSAKIVSSESTQEQNGTLSYIYLVALKSLTTAAVTSIQLYPEESKNWVQYTTATLYGISKS
jgi:hypothetical protein